jgi:hypothetical protein
MLALGALIFLPVPISGPTPYAPLVEIAKTDNVFLDMQVPPMFEEDAGVSRDTVLFAAEEMALFFRAVGKTFLILLAAVLGVGLVSAGAGGARFSSSSPNRSDATGFSWRSGR